MENSSILQYLRLSDISLKQVSAKTLKPSKKINKDLSSKWECKIASNDGKRLELLANVNTVLEAMFELKASFVIEFKVDRALEIDEIQENIADILYYGGTNYTLLSSFLSNFMIGIPVPIAPNIDKSDIKIVESLK